jgi:uncharacterized protein YcbX
MVVDAAGRMLTQRVLPRLAVVQAAFDAAGLTLGMQGFGEVRVAAPGGAAERVEVSIWRDRLVAAVADEAACAWLSGALGMACRLVHMDDTAARPVSSAHGQAGEHVSFADGFPVLLTSLGSLGDLNARLGRGVPISRFRGNLVVEGAAAWEEDCWRRVRIGGAEFRVAKACDRCIVTTIDQASGERPDRMEPLRTLGAFRHDERGIMFGQNLVPVVMGRVSVGDRVEVLERGAPNVVPVVS